MSEDDNVRTSGFLRDLGPATRLAATPTNGCLATGCGLLDMDHGRWVHGDLHVADGSFIFVACMEGARPAWQHGTAPEIKHVVAHLFFERRGIIVLRAHKSLLSPALRGYIGGDWS